MNSLITDLSIEKNIEIKVCDNICLKTLSENDVSLDYLNWLNNYEITKFTEQRFLTHTLQSVKSFVNDNYYSQKFLLFGIFFKKEHIGNIKLGPIRLEHLSAEISYIIGEKKFWGRGITSKCVGAVVDFAINKLNLKKINAGYYENNLGSAKVLKKCGFVIEGIRHSDIIFENKRIKSILVGYIPD